MSVNEEMNSVGSRIPSKWKRTTVADGDWLQKYTLDPLSARDEFLASKIQEGIDGLSAEIDARKAGDAYLSANLIGFSAEYFEFKDNVETSAENLSAALKEEIDRAKNAESNLDSRINTERTDRINEDAKLQNQLDILKASTDVIDVWGSYAQFSEGSGKYFPGETSALITDNDIIKIINDEYTPVSVTDNPTTGHQTYYQWKFNTPTPAQPGPDDGSWSFIGYTDPYYNIDEVDNLFDNMSATIADTYLSANTDAVSAGHNIVVTEQDGPVIGIKTKDNVDFTNVSSTTFSGINIYGSTKNTTIDGLIGSAQSGQDAWNKVNSAYWSASNFEGTNTASGRLSGSFELSAGENIDLSIVGNRINIDVLPGTHYYEARCDLFNPADIDNNTTFWKANGENILNDVNDNIPVIIKNLDTHELWSFKKFHNTESTDYDVYFSTVTELTEGHNIVIGSAHITKDTDLKYKVASCNKYLTNSYSATIAYQAQNLGNVGSADVIGSSQSGKFAWNVINSAKFSAIDTTTSTDYISGGFAIKAGDNLTLTYANKTITLNASDTGITAISAGNTTYTGPVFSASAGTGINFVNGNNNVLGIKASDTLINSATGGSAAYNWITAQSATLYPGSGINFYNAGSNRLGIAVDYSTATEDSVTYVTALNNIPLSAGMKYENGNCIEVNNSTKQINLSSNIVANNISATNSYTTSAHWEYNNVVYNGSAGIGYYIGQPEGLYLSGKWESTTNTTACRVRLDALGISAVSGQSSKSTSWFRVVDVANGNYVKANDNEDITLSTALPANTANMVNGVIYLV